MRFRNLINTTIVWGFHKFIQPQPASTSTLTWLSFCLRYSRILGCLFKTLSPESLFDYLATNDTLPQVPLRWAVHTTQWRNNRSTSSVKFFWKQLFFFAILQCSSICLWCCYRWGFGSGLLILSVTWWYVSTYCVKTEQEATDISLPVLKLMHLCVMQTCYAALSHTHWPIYFNRTRYTEHRLEGWLLYKEKDPINHAHRLRAEDHVFQSAGKGAAKKTWRWRAASSSDQKKFCFFFCLILES